MKEELKGKSGIYLAGNTLPEYDPYEQRRREERRRRLEEKDLDERVKKYVRRKPPYGFSEFFPIALIIIIFAILCIILLHEQYLTMKIKSDIQAKEDEYLQLVQDNKAYETKLNRSIDMDEVYRRATQELGMVYPEEGQIIVYHKQESGYVRQYEQIP